MEPGVYTLSELNPDLQTPYARFQEVFDGYELVISDVENLTILPAATSTQILTLTQYADVLKFVNCRGIQLKSLEL
jgi:hypothetical protein